jgi:hypothetical protein
MNLLLWKERGLARVIVSDLAVGLNSLSQCRFESSDMSIIYIVYGVLYYTDYSGLNNTGCRIYMVI